MRISHKLFFDTEVELRKAGYDEEDISQLVTVTGHKGKTG